MSPLLFRFLSCTSETLPPHTAKHFTLPYRVSPTFLSPSRSLPPSPPSPSSTLSHSPHSPFSPFQSCTLSHILFPTLLTNNMAEDKLKEIPPRVFLFVKEVVGLVVVGGRKGTFSHSSFSTSSYAFSSF